MRRVSAALLAMVMAVALVGAGGSACASHSGTFPGAAPEHADMDMSGMPMTDDAPCDHGSLPEGCAAMPSCATIVADAPDAPAPLRYVLDVPVESVPAATHVSVTVSPDTPPPRLT